MRLAKLRLFVPGFAAGVLICLLAAGCDGEQSDWKLAQTANTVEAFSGFLEKHPRGPLADQARKEIEQREWKLAQTANTVEAFSAFLQKHPQGPLADQARKEIEKREWNQATAKDTVESYKAFMGKYPNGEYVGVAKKAIDVLDRRAKLDAVLGKHDPQALRSFVADPANQDVLERLKTAEGGTLTLTSQPAQAFKGYRLQVTDSKKTGLHGIAVVVPSGGKLDFKPFGFSNGTQFKIAKGQVSVSIVNNKMGTPRASGEVKLAGAMKEAKAVKLASEYTDLAPNMLLQVSDSEVLVTRGDEATLQRELGSAPGGKQTKCSVTKGNLYLLTLR
jgi:hypothetical protein